MLVTVRAGISRRFKFFMQLDHLLRRMTLKAELLRHFDLKRHPVRSLFKKMYSDEM